MKKIIISFALFASLTLSSCSLMTYFSTVFDWAYPNYTPEFDESGRLMMNSEATIQANIGEDTYFYHVALFENGFVVDSSITKTTSEGVNNVLLTTLVDYEESGVFINRVENEVIVQHQFQTLTNQEIVDLTSMASQWITVYAEQIEPIIHDSLTDLAIGGASVNGDVYSFNLPLSSFLDSASILDLIGYETENLNVVFGYNKVTMTMMIDISLNVLIDEVWTVATIDADFLNPGQISALDYLLSEEEKTGFTDFVLI